MVGDGVTSWSPSTKLGRPRADIQLPLWGWRAGRKAKGETDASAPPPRRQIIDGTLGRVGTGTPRGPEAAGRSPQGQWSHPITPTQNQGFPSTPPAPREPQARGAASRVQVRNGWEDFPPGPEALQHLPRNDIVTRDKEPNRPGTLTTVTTRCRVGGHMGTGDTPGQGQGPHSRGLGLGGPGPRPAGTPPLSHGQRTAVPTRPLGIGQRPPLSATGQDRRLDVEWG